MTRVNVIVEGQTEETFVRDLLAHEFGFKNIFFIARCIETSRKKSRKFRGGLLNYPKTKNDIVRWLKQDDTAIVTTMFDFYGLPDDFPGMNELAKFSSPYDIVNHLELELKKDIDFGDRFIPYIQLHEFEGLLFSDIEKIDKIMGEIAYLGQIHHRIL